MTQNVQPSSNWKLPFFTIWAGQAFSLLGSGLVQFVLVWWLTIETGSATVLAVATLVAILPQVVVGPLAGPLVDRLNRRTILIVADGVVALATLWLIYLYSIDAMQVWHVYAAMLIRASVGAFHFPTMQASTSLLVPHEHLSRVAGLNQALQGITGILSPALGALLLQLFELRTALAVDVGTALLAILPLFFIAIPQPPRTTTAVAESGRASFGQDFRAGLRYVRGWPGLMAILIMAMLINFLLAPSAALMPLLARNELNGDAGLLATMEALLGVGVIVGGVVLSAWGGFKRRVVTSLVGLMGIGAGVVMVGLAPASAAWLAVAGMFVMGAMQSLTNGPLFAVLQAVVAPDMQGRVLSLIGSLATAMTPLSLIVAGPVADALGVRTWYLVGGVVCALMGVVGFFIPAVMQLEDGRAQPASELSPADERLVEIT
jgi:DHA3 family macrolide efflux protein-like MFS transporter